MSDTRLPEPFTDLEPLAAVWALATETERNQQRLSSTMAQIQAFYDTLLPRMEAILTYLSAFPPETPDALPQEVHRLLCLALAMAEITTAVELHQQPDVPAGFDPQRFIPDHERTKR